MKRCLSTLGSVLLLGALASGCLSVGPNGPSLMVPLTNERFATDDEATSLRAQMKERIAKLARFTGDFRLTAVGPEGRIRLLGQLLLERPDHARVTLLLPFGAPAWLGVCDGKTLAAWDVPRARIRRAEATRKGLAELSAVGDVGLTPEEAIGLGFGEVVPAPGAKLSFSPKANDQEAHWLWRWRDAEGFARALKVDERGVALAYEIKNDSGDTALITFFERAELGIPSGMRLRLEPHHPTAQSSQADTTVAELKLSDVREVPPPTPNAFVLSERPNP